MPTVYPDNRLWGQPDGTYVGYTLSTNNGIQTLNMTDDLYFRKDSAGNTAGYWNIPTNTVVITNGNILDINIYNTSFQSTAYFYLNGTIVNNGVYPTQHYAKYVKWAWAGKARVSSTGKIINYPNNYFYTTGFSGQSQYHYLEFYGTIINSGLWWFSRYNHKAASSRFSGYGGLFLSHRKFYYFYSSSGTWTDSGTGFNTKYIHGRTGTININKDISIPEINAIDINGNAINASLFQIENGKTLNINSGNTLTNNGIIGNDGNIENNGTTTNNGTIINNNIITDNGTITNDGIILSNSVITDPSGNTVIPGGSGTNNYPGNNGTTNQIDITSNFTLPDSLTFNVPDGETLQIHGGVTFTI